MVIHGTRTGTGYAGSPRFGPSNTMWFLFAQFGWMGQAAGRIARAQSGRGGAKLMRSLHAAKAQNCSTVQPPHPPNPTEHPPSSLPPSSVLPLPPSHTLHTTSTCACHAKRNNETSPSAGAYLSSSSMYPSKNIRRIVETDIPPSTLYSGAYLLPRPAPPIRPIPTWLPPS